MFYLTVFQLTVHMKTDHSGIEIIIFFEYLGLERDNRWIAVYSKRKGDGIHREALEITIGIDNRNKIVKNGLPQKLLSYSITHSN